MRRHITTALVLVLTAVLLAQDRSAKKEPSVVFRDITFIGVRQMPPAPLKRLVQRYEGQLLEDANFADELAERVRDLYQQHGFFQAQITLETAPSNDSPKYPSPLTYRIEEGRRFLLKTIKFENGKAFPASALRPLFPIRTGEIFNIAKIRLGLENLRKAYGTRGYINFTPVPDTIVNNLDGTVSLTINLDEGKPFRVGSVKIFGLDWDRTARLLCGWPLKPGAIYRSDVIERFFLRNKGWLPQQAPLYHMETIRDEKDSTIDVLLNFSSTEAPGVAIEAHPEIVLSGDKPPTK